MRPIFEAVLEGYARRRRSIQVIEWKYAGGWPACDRDAPTTVDLQPPAE